MTASFDFRGVDSLANAVMRGVILSGVVHNTNDAIDNVAICIRVIRDECKTLLTDERYANERDCLLRGSLHEGYVINLVVLNCVERIRKESS